MLKSLSVKNFRGIREGKIEDLAKINILIGQNNSGKSTILDLLCFIRAPLNPFDDFNEPILNSLLHRRVKREVLTEIEFFHHYLPENEVEFLAEFEKGSPLYFKAKYSETNIQFIMLVPASNISIATFFLRQGIAPQVATPFGTDTVRNPINYINESYERVKINSVPAQNVEPWDYMHAEFAKQNLEFMSNVVLIDADFVRKIESIEKAYWAQMLKKRSDKKLRETLNATYNSQIESFSFSPYRGNSSKLFAMLPEDSRHIDDYGDGFRYAFSILTVASQAKNTALLLEEPEVHQHEGALQPMFNALSALASSNNLQIFISTHSPKVVDIWSKISTDLKVFHLSMNEEQLEVRTIPSTDAKLLIDLGVNPLRLDETFTYLVVEGSEDKLFLENMTKKLKQKNLKELGYEVLECSKDGQQQTVSALASTGKNIVVCRDYDNKRTIEELLEPYVASLRNKYVEVEVTDNKAIVKRTKAQLKFVPVGLPEDKELSELGIERFAMEDFLVKLLGVDERVRKWAGISLEELKNRAQSLKDKADLKSSKTLMMTLGVLKNQNFPSELIPCMIDQADEKVLNDLVKSVTSQLF